MADRAARAKVISWLVLWMALVLIAVVLVAQNSRSTELQVLGWTIQAPLFVILVAAIAIGWGLGALATQVVSWRRRHRHVRRGDARAE